MHIFFQIIIQTYNSNNWSVVTTPEEEEVAVSAVFVFPDIFWKHVSTNKKLNPDLNLYDTDTLYKTWQNSICSCKNVSNTKRQTQHSLLLRKLQKLHTNDHQYLLPVSESLHIQPSLAHG